ncbi:MAG: hypothetical protein ACE5E8_00215 [Acidimicrobiia bacterium]
MRAPVMYHRRKAGSCHENTVVRLSAKVPSPYATTPMNHQKRWRAFGLAIQCRYREGAKPAATVVVASGRKEAAVRSMLLLGDVG